MILQNRPKYHEPRSGGWYLENFEIIRAGIIANITCKSCYYLFIIEAEKFSVTQERPFFLRLKKTNTGVYVRNNLFSSMEEMIDSFFVKPVQTIHGNMKHFNESNL